VNEYSVRDLIFSRGWGTCCSCGGCSSCWGVNRESREVRPEYNKALKHFSNGIAVMRLRDGEQAVKVLVESDFFLGKVLPS